MAATVVSVVIFLCGVLVGRGVRAGPGSPADASSAEHRRRHVAAAAVVGSRRQPAGSDPTAAPAPPAPADDLSYFDRLEKPNAPAEQSKLKPDDAPRSSSDPRTPRPPPTAGRRTQAPSSDLPAARARPPRRRPRRNQRLRATRAAAPRRQPAPKEAASSVAGTRGRAAGQGFAVQVAALNVRSEADAIAKRLSSKGYAAYVLSAGRRHAVGLPRARRPVQDAARSRDRRRQAAEGRAVQALGHALIPSLLAFIRLRLAAASGVLLALSFPKFGHPAVGWVALAPLLVALAASPATANLAAPCAAARPADRRRLLHRHALLDHPRHGGLRRAPALVAVLVNAVLIAYLALFPARVRRRSCAASFVASDRARCSRRPASGSRPSSDEPICSPDFRGCCSDTASERAAGGAAREPLRRLRRVGARGAVSAALAGRGGPARRRSPTRAAARSALPLARRRCSRSSSCSSPSWGSVGAASPAARADAPGEPIRVGLDSGQRRSGGEMGRRDARPRSSPTTSG